MGQDVDFFYFPAFREADLGRPVLGAGTLFGITDPSEATNAMLEFLKLPIAHELWMAQGGLPDRAWRREPGNLCQRFRARAGRDPANATTFRFDASDLMPGEIGAGVFWTGMVDYVTGASAEDVATTIQDRWDTLQ